MSIFSRRRKFRNLVSSAISTVVLSSCASQVAQCWDFHVKFHPLKDQVAFEYKIIPKFKPDQKAEEWFSSIFTISRGKSVVSFRPSSKCFESEVSYRKAYQKEFFPFSRQKESKVQVFVALLRMYWEECLCLMDKLGYTDDEVGYKSNDFFEMFDLRFNSAREKYNSLESGDQKKVNKLRELSDKIKEAYNDLYYKITGMHLDMETETLFISAVQSNNVYIDYDIFRDEGFQRLFSECKVKKLKGFEIEEYEFKSHNDFIFDLFSKNRLDAKIDLISPDQYGKIMYFFDLHTRDCKANVGTIDHISLPQM